MKKYWQIFVMAVSMSTQYRVNLLWRITGTVIRVAMILAVWTALLASGFGGNIFDQRSLVDYYLVIGFVSAFIDFAISTELSEEIWRGDLARDIVRPYNFFIRYFLTSLPDRLIVFVIFLMFYLVRLGFKVDVVSFVGGILISFLALIMYFIVQLGISGLAFWFRRVHGFSGLFFQVGNLFSGIMIPISLLPLVWQETAHLLPFQFLGYVPAMIFMGKGQENIINAIALIVVWILFFGLITNYIWSKGLKSFEAGGN